MGKTSQEMNEIIIIFLQFFDVLVVIVFLLNLIKGLRRLSEMKTLLDYNIIWCMAALRR